MRSFRIHRMLAISVISAFAVLITAAVSTLIYYSGHMIDAKRLSGLEEENGRLAARIENYQKEMGELKVRMEKNFELQNRTRLVASLEPLTRDVLEVGVGGPGPSHENVDLTGPERTLSMLEEDLEKLVRQSNLQLQNYKEILAILEKDQKIRDSTPSIRPVKSGFLSSRFGRRMDPFTGRISQHRGVDFRARTGTPVMSTADGIVTLSKKNGSFGLVVEVSHGNGFKTKYAHLSKILVKRGQRVKRGEIIGLVGNTGRSTGSHLHYEVLFGKAHRNPLHYIIPEGVYFD